MADKSKIEWTDASWNPIRARDRESASVGWHCVHVSEGCRFCYAEVFNRRLGTGRDYTAQAEKLVETYLDQKVLGEPMRWDRPRKIFVGSMTDLFAPFVTDEMLDKVFTVMQLAPQHTYQVLTKRPARMRAYIQRRISEQPPGRDEWPLKNVWLGISAEDQDAVDERLHFLQTTPAAVRFISFEPLLGPIDKVDLTGVAWAIVGGESGVHARPMHAAWAQVLRDLCAAAGVAFFFKQWGNFVPHGQHFADGSVNKMGHPADKQWARFADGATAWRTEKKKAGHILDGQVWQQFPEVTLAA